jgi:uncharacterized membrane protein YgcG
LQSRYPEKKYGYISSGAGFPISLSDTSDPYTKTITFPFDVSSSDGTIYQSFGTISSTNLDLNIKTCSDNAPSLSINYGADFICDRQCSEVGWNTGIDGSCVDPCIVDFDIGDNWIQSSIDSCNNLDIAVYDGSKIINPKIGVCEEICFLHLKPNTTDDTSTDSTEEDYSWKDEEMDFTALEQILDLEKMMDEIEEQEIEDNGEMTFVPIGKTEPIVYSHDNEYVQDMWQDISDYTADDSIKSTANNILNQSNYNSSGNSASSGSSSSDSGTSASSGSSSSGSSTSSGGTLSAPPSAGGGSGGNSLSDEMKNLGDSVNSNTDATNSNTDSLDTLNQNIENLNNTLNNTGTGESDIDDGADSVFEFVDIIKSQADSIETSVNNIQGLLENGFEFRPPSVTSLPDCNKQADFIVNFVNQITFLAPILFLFSMIGATILSIKLFVFGLTKVKLS